MEGQVKGVVITGATSMIGTALVNACVQNNIPVLAIVRRQSARMDRLPESDLIKICESDLNELSNIEDITRTYDVFYHLAWGNTSKSGRDNPILQELNIKYTLDAVELAKRLGCRKFIGAGSQAEYGIIDGIINPDTAVNPVSAYGMAKYAAGKLSEKRCIQLGMIHIWARVFSVYGRYDNEGTMLTYAIDQFIKGEPAKFSAADQLWDYLNEKDAGEIFLRLGRDVNENKVYCVANGDSKPLREFIHEVKECFGTNVECEFAEKDKTIKPVCLNPDVSRLTEDIRYKPKVKFSEGIKDMIEYRKTLLISDK